MPRTPSRMFKIQCVGDSSNVAHMLEDIAKKIKDGAINGKEDMFYQFDSHGYVKEELRGDWYQKEMNNVR